MNATTKICTACGEEKPLEAFHRHKTAAHGRHSTCAECKNLATSTAWYSKSPSERRALSRRRQLWHRYRITPDQYDLLLASQNGACAICSGTNPWHDDWLQVDHDHETGEVRGLLCRECNVGIGKFMDNPDLLRLAAEYLKEE